MRICPVCRTKNLDNKIDCGNCGFPLNTKPGERVIVIPPSYPNSGLRPTYYVERQHRRGSGLRTAAKVFMILSCVYCAILVFVLSLLWLPPFGRLSSREEVTIIVYSSIAWLGLFFHIYMTRIYSGRIEKDWSIGTGFKIVTLLFVDTIAGILMLCDND